MKKVVFLLSLVWATTACNQQKVEPMSAQPAPPNPAAATSASARLGLDSKEPTGPFIPVLYLPFGTVYYTREGSSAPQYPSANRGVIVLYSKFVNKPLPWVSSGKPVKKIEVYRRDAQVAGKLYYLTTLSGAYNGPQQQTVPPNKDLLNAGNSWYLSVAPGPYTFYYRYYDEHNALITEGQFFKPSVKAAQYSYMGD